MYLAEARASVLARYRAIGALSVMFTKNLCVQFGKKSEAITCFDDVT